MNLHEYQSKIILAQYGLPIPKGVVMGKQDAASKLSILIGDRLVVKTQIHAGGRGKAGGVKVVPRDQVMLTMQDLCSRPLVTKQNAPEGQVVESVLVEECLDIAREFYMALMLDRYSRCISLILCAQGGMDIEEVMHHHPEKMIKISIDPAVGLSSYQLRNHAQDLGLNIPQSEKIFAIAEKAYRIFWDYQASLLEFNPLVLTHQGDFCCLDVKMSLDERALYRRPELESWRDRHQDDPKEDKARDMDLSYVALQGNIGCLVNGAGLAMSTMDMIQLHGGSPANFLDIGGGATQERVEAALNLIMQDPLVRVILINIFGGIVHCEMIAQGLLNAVKTLPRHVPLVVRLEGNGAREAREILAASGEALFPVATFEEAAKLAVQKAKDIT